VVGFWLLWAIDSTKKSGQKALLGVLFVSSNRMSQLTEPLRDIVAVVTKLRMPSSRHCFP